MESCPQDKTDTETQNIFNAKATCILFNDYRMFFVLFIVEKIVDEVM